MEAAENTTDGVRGNRLCSERRSLQGRRNRVYMSGSRPHFKTSDNIPRLPMMEGGGRGKEVFVDGLVDVFERYAAALSLRLHCDLPIPCRLAVNICICWLSSDVHASASI